MKKDFAETLKKMRIKAGYSQKEVYEMFNIRQSTFSAWETGRAEPSADMLLKLCKLYNVNDILGAFGFDGYNEDGSIQLNLKEIDMVEKYRFISAHSPEGAKVVDTVLDREYSVADQLKKQNEKINELEQTIAEKNLNNPGTRLINYYYRLASAGTGQIIFDTPPTKRIEIPDTPENQKAAYAIGVNGDSMEPVYHDGDTLLIEMTEEILPGDIGIFLVDDCCYVKKRGKNELISINKDSPNISLNESARCMGKVINKLNNDKRK